MGAFWNPSGGIIVKDRELSNKEGLALKQRKRRKWTGNPQYPFSPLKHWFENIWITVWALLS
jgi:hypothetical protein